MLFESNHQTSGFDLEHFSREWRKMFQSYDGYLDNATKDTLYNFDSGKNADTAQTLPNAVPHRTWPDVCAAPNENPTSVVPVRMANP